MASGGPAKTLYFRCFVGQLVILQRTGWNCTICGFLLVLAIMISVEQLMSLQPNYRIFLLVNNICANIIDLHIFLGVFFEQGSRPRMWASTPWAICRTDRLFDYSTIVQLSILHFAIYYRRLHGSCDFIFSFRLLRVGRGVASNSISPKIVAFRIFS